MPVPGGEPVLVWLSGQTRHTLFDARLVWSISAWSVVVAPFLR